MDSTKQTSQLITTPEPLLVRADRASAICGVSPRKWAEMASSGRIPPSYKLGGCKVWRLADLRLWVEMDMPNLDRFLQLKEARK